VQTRQRSFYAENRVRLISERLAYIAANPEKVRAQRKRYRREEKLAALRHYGGDPPSCACCGEAHDEFLTIDHINGGGAVHRREVGSHGSRIYRWLRANGWPEGFRVLCMNCNHALGLQGYCPHGFGLTDRKLDPLPAWVAYADVIAGRR
jgi:hypothetical protein